jgi:PmbA protein
MIAEKSVKLALEKIGQRKVSSGKYDMLVLNRVSSKLIGIILSSLKGSKLWNKSSFLDGKIGEKIFTENLTIYDAPHIKRGLGSKEFDGDGFPTKERTIVKDGVLNYYLLNNYFAKKMDMIPTTGSTTNIMLKEGNKSLNEIIKSVNKGIYVKGFLGGNFNSSTGDFSFGINGTQIEYGELTVPVNEMNISGNAIELFGKLIDIGNDSYSYSSYRAPSLLFEKIEFNGI